MLQSVLSEAVVSLKHAVLTFESSATRDIMNYGSVLCFRISASLYFRPGLMEVPVSVISRVAQGVRVQRLIKLTFDGNSLEALHITVCLSSVDCRRGNFEGCSLADQWWCWASAPTACPGAGTLGPSPASASSALALSPSLHSPAWSHLPLLAIGAACAVESSSTWAAVSWLVS